MPSPARRSPATQDACLLSPSTVAAVRTFQSHLYFAPLPSVYVLCPLSCGARLLDDGWWLLQRGKAALRRPHPSPSPSDLASRRHWNCSFKPPLTSGWGGRHVKLFCPHLGLALSSIQRSRPADPPPFWNILFAQLLRRRAPLPCRPLLGHLGLLLPSSSTRCRRRGAPGLRPRPVYRTPQLTTLAGVSVRICSIHAVAPATETKPRKNFFFLSFVEKMKPFPWFLKFSCKHS